MRGTTTMPRDGTAEWGRRRLLGILAAVATVVVLLVCSLAYAAYLAIDAVEGEDASPTPDLVFVDDPEVVTETSGLARRDQIAGAPMLSVPDSAALPAAASGSPTPTIAIPASTGLTGPAFVMTGFPSSPEGAIGQLAQIDSAVLESMSLETARDVYSSWALPGGVHADDWWITVSVRAFLSSSGMGQIKAFNASVVLEPAAAMVKGVDGSDWATVCLLLRVTATYKSEAQIAFAHCERMQWVGGRWMIAPGTPPAPGPATWPGTKLAHEAGWRTWSTAGVADVGSTTGEQ